jgi:Flp pilus assembly secretin CpaC
MTHDGFGFCIQHYEPTARMRRKHPSLALASAKTATRLLAVPAKRAVIEDMQTIFDRCPRVARALRREICFRWADANKVITAYLLERAGALTILAEPNLTAITGQTASFLAGGEVPIPHPAARGEPPSFYYKEFGVSLEFTPTVIRTNRIALRVEPAVSAISEFSAVKIGDTDIPSFTVRRADTTVEVVSGQAFALAGLFQRQLSKDVDRLPLLGEIPVLGALFTSERYRRDETELVILVTTYLVQPTRNRIAATPIDRPGQLAANRRPVISPAAFGPPPLQSGYFIK